MARSRTRLTANSTLQRSPASRCASSLSAIERTSDFPVSCADFCEVAFASRRLSPHPLTPTPKGLRAAEDLAVEDSVPGIGVRSPVTPSFGDLAELVLGREAFGNSLTGDRGIGHAVGPQ